MLWQQTDEEVRAFVAVELTAEAKEVLRTLVQSLGQEKFPTLRLGNPEGTHLTLKFLGQVPTTRLGDIADALDQKIVHLHTFQVELQELGAFPNLRVPRVLWVGLGEGRESLQRLAQAVEEALEPLGFPRERRRFTPHITLGRLREGALSQERQQAGEALARLSGKERGYLAVEGVGLIRSELLPQGAQYTRLHWAPLQGTMRAE